MTSIRLHVGLIATVLICGSILPASAESLADVYALSKQKDPKYLAMRSEYQATGFAVDEAMAGLLPSASWQYGRTRTSQNIVSSDNAVFATGHASFPTKDRTLSISLPIFKLASWRNWSQSKATEKQAAAAYAAAEQDLIVRTAAAYMGVLAAEDALALARGENESIKRQLDLVDTKFKNGQAIKVNLFDAQARYALKQSDVVAAENDLADKKQALREITGEASSRLTPLPKEMPLVVPDPQDSEAWVKTSLEQNLMLQARQQAVEVAKQEIEKRKAGYYPTLDLSVSQNRRDTGGSLFGGGSDVKTRDVMLRLNVPIFEGGATMAQVSQARKHYETAQEDQERDRRQVERQARAAYQGVVGGIVRVRALDQSVTALEGARQLKEEGFKAGISTILGVLDAERDLYAAKRDAAQSRYDYQLNSLRLKQAAGSLSEDDLLQISTLME